MTNVFVFALGLAAGIAWGLYGHDTHMPAALWIAGICVIVLAQMGAYEESS